MKFGFVVGGSKVSEWEGTDRALDEYFGSSAPASSGLYINIKPFNEE